MTADNRTNEKIVTDLYPLPHDHNRRANALTALAALEKAGRIIGEPTPEQVEAAAKAIADCHNPGMFEKYPENWRVEARAALVAATRVPVQGEPKCETCNDVGLVGSDHMNSGNCPDCNPEVVPPYALYRMQVTGAIERAAREWTLQREALYPRNNVTQAQHIVRRVAELRDPAVQGEPNDELIEYALDYIENGTMRPERRKALQALASRATVPDAATERWRGDYFIQKRAADKAETERDAAPAAVERVRALAYQHRSVEQHNEMVPMSDIADLIREPSSAEYLAALDGAPEPDAAEKKYAIEYSSKTRTSIHEQESLESARVELARIPHPNGRIMQQVVAPWLPVEGESKP